MSKYTSVHTDIFSVFASTAWINEDITALPENFTGSPNMNEYVRVTIVPARDISQYSDPHFIGGIVSIDIFTQFGLGPARSHEIAGILDNYFSATIVGSTQFSPSTLSPYGRDRDNPSLYRSIYTIKFSHYGA